MTEHQHKSNSALRVNKGITQPLSVNIDAVQKLKNSKAPEISIKDYIEGIKQGNRMLLSKAITLVESVLPEHQELAQQLIEQCLPLSSNSLRIGISGVPGVGKSTFIESFGIHIINLGRKVAVLAIDPSSSKSKGSILGDKTRMEDLANNPAAFIRPSASTGSLGGVARKTNETIILCEAAGFDTIFIETVGVGQSETAVHSMVDFFLLLMLAGAGDELQGIKRGIMEMADLILINKADGDNIQKALNAKVQYKNALHLFPLPESKWNPTVKSCSALNSEGITQVWELLKSYERLTKSNGYFENNRKNQSVNTMNETINQRLGDGLFLHPQMKKIIAKLEEKIRTNKLSAYIASQQILDKYFQLIKK
ncbi:MAG: methylmalonyl Co-A mutase-associated GTPase MeaB [Bacteroidetes bacterium]|nr:methylmalonyl Co-A mutase-associated GTPase MeaB [Bacteroidota bacterium]